MKRSVAELTYVVILASHILIISLSPYLALKPTLQEQMVLRCFELSCALQIHRRRCPYKLERPVLLLFFSPLRSSSIRRKLRLT